jgi:hypothetical protein
MVPGEEGAGEQIIAALETGAEHPGEGEKEGNGEGQQNDVHEKGVERLHRVPALPIV